MIKQMPKRWIVAGVLFLIAIALWSADVSKALDPRKGSTDLIYLAKPLVASIVMGASAGIFVGGKNGWIVGLGIAALCAMAWVSMIIADLDRVIHGIQG